MLTFMNYALLNNYRGVNPTKRASPLQKKLNGASPMPIKKSGVDVRKTPNGKVNVKK